MNARYLTDYSLDGYLPSPPRARATLQRDRLNLRPVFESIGWILAGATLGCATVVLGAWGLVHLTEPHSPLRATAAVVYQAPASLPQ
jgi:hypothetical protein